MQNKKQVSTEELLFYIFLLFTMGAKGIGLTGGQRVFTLCQLIAYACIAVKIAVTEYNVKEWFVNLGLVILALLIGRSSGETAALAAALMIIGMKNISLEKAMKAALAIWGSTFLLSAFAGVLGLNDGVVVVHEKLGLGPIIRYSLGYTHPNVLHVTYFMIVMLVLYVFPLKGKKLWAAAGLFFIGNIYIFLYSISYTGIIIVTAFLCMRLYTDARGTLSKTEKILIELAAPFCMLFPIAGPFLIRGKAFDIINKLLSTRFALVHYFFTEFRVSLFGTVTVTPADAHLTLDSSFAYLLMYYGIPAFILMIAAYLAVNHKYIKENRWREASIMTCTALAGVTEQFLYNLSFKNITFFCIGDYLFNVLLVREGSRFSDKKIRLLPLKKQVWNMSACPEMIRRMPEALRKARRKAWFFAAAAGAVVCVILVLLLWKAPGMVYVNRGLADCNAEYVIVEENREWADNCIRIGDMKPGEKIYEFDGNIIEMEKVRAYASAVVWGSLLGLTGYIAVLFSRKYDK